MPKTDLLYGAIDTFEETAKVAADRLRSLVGALESNFPGCSSSPTAPSDAAAPTTEAHGNVVEDAGEGSIDPPSAA